MIDRNLAISLLPIPAGTFAGMTEKLDYLSSLGVNAVELQPIHEFNELEYYAVREPSSHFRNSAASSMVGVDQQIHVAWHLCFDMFAVASY